jgi:hypothetical protein
VSANGRDLKKPVFFQSYRRDFFPTDNVLASIDVLTYLWLTDAECSVNGVLSGRDRINDVEGQPQATLLAAGTDDAGGETEELKP